MTDRFTPPSPASRCEVRPLWDDRRRLGAGPSCRTARHLCDLVALATAVVFGVPARHLIAARRRDATTAFARQTAMYVAHVAFGLTYREIGCAFGRDRTTAAHACRQVEQRRDDPLLDAVVGALEDACVGWRRRLSAPAGTPPAKKVRP